MKPVPSYPALLLTQNRHRFYFATIPVDDLFPLCFVARRENDPTAGFQRTLSEQRADDISKYLDAGTGSIPTNIVLSAQTDAEFAFKSREKLISFKRVQNAFLVLDGQHRLWGYKKCPTRHRVPVAIYQGLSRAEEARLFIDINTNQRGVPAALLLDIKKMAEIESDRDSILRHIFDQLAKDSSSALNGRLSPSKSLPNRISRVTFNRAVGTTLNSSIILNADQEGRYKLIKNYVNAFDAELEDKRMLTRSAFFEAIFDLFDEIVRDTITKHKNAKQPSLHETVRVIAKIDFSERGARLNKKRVTDLAKTALGQSLALSADML
jgi:DNA sulfur modification protein DndB